MRVVPRLVVIAVAAAILALLPFQLSGYHQLEGARVAIFFAAILGLNIVTGYTGQISLGHGAFMAIGGYTTAIIVRDHHWHVLWTLPVAFLVAFACGVVVGVPALRLSGIYLALATFAVAVSVPQFVRKFSHFTGGTEGIQIDRVSGRWLYGVSWTCAAILFVLAWLLLRGRIGRAFRAARDSEVAAISSGINLAIYKTLAFGVSAAFAGVAGSLFVLASNGYAHPDSFGVFLSLEILIGATVAGLGSLWGVVVGAAFVDLLPNVSQSTPLLGSEHGTDIAFGLIVILVVFLLPSGFAGFLQRLAVRR
jgi:branched-chain amino acid transport system permease protein